MAASLNALLANAKRAARRRGQRLSTAHLLLAMLQEDKQTGILLAQQGVREMELIGSLDAADDEPASAVELALERSVKLAQALSDPEPRAIHLLLAITREPRSSGYRCLERIGTQANQVCEKALAILQPQAERGTGGRASAMRGRSPAPLPPLAPTPRAQPIRHDRWVGPPKERRGDPSDNQPQEKAENRTNKPAPIPAPRLPEKKRKPEKNAPFVSESSGPASLLDPARFPTLCSIGRNLTQAAARGEIDPIFGRDREMELVLDVLARRRSNNPILVGPPGVGKTAVVEGIALKLARSAPGETDFADRVMVEISVGRLVSGTGVRGALSEKLYALHAEVSSARGAVILFIDEIHALLGFQENAEGMANELKAFLARGDLSCIGATTESEYRRLFERDAALARRFTRIDIQQPDAEQALEILRGLSPHYEKHHGVAYEPAALQAAVQMSIRYLAEQQLPDKAIGLIDQAAARTRRKGENIVKAEAVAEVVCEKTRVPVERLMMRDSDRLLTLEQHLEERVIGQAEAVASIAPALRKSAAGFRGTRPLGTFLFLGPTGVGKTEMAKAINELLFPQGEITRFDMSEFSEAHSVARLLGAPPGYVGHEEGGQLTEAVRTRPYQLILLDEIDKAHSEVLLALLPLLDEGRLTDARGRTVDFTNTVIAMTSNLGGHRKETRPRIGFGAEDTEDKRRTGLRAEALEAARAALPPELWNRIDEPLYFFPLGEKEVAAIAGRFIDRAAAVVREQHGIELEVHPSAIDALIAAGGFDPFLGARPMQRTVGRLVEAPLASSILSGELVPGATVQLRGKGTEVLICRQGSAAA